MTHNLVQVSMGGPHVNWKTVEIIQEYWEYDDPDGPDLIEIGSCGWHVLHGSYGTAQKATDWNLDKLLKAIYSLYKLSPARREDYLKVNELLESHDSKSVAYFIPQKFCGHRWLENGKALKRAIELHSKIFLLSKREISFKNDRKLWSEQSRFFETVLNKIKCSYFKL